MIFGKETFENLNHKSLTLRFMIDNDNSLQEETDRLEPSKLKLNSTVFNNFTNCLQTQRFVAS